MEHFLVKTLVKFDRMEVNAFLEHFSYFVAKRFSKIKTF